MADTQELSIESLFFRTGGATAPRLRIGLLIPSGPLPFLAAETIRHLNSCDFASIVALVAAKGRRRDSSATGPLLYRLYRQLDERAHPAATRAVAATAVDSIADDALSFVLDPELTAEQMAALSACHLDVILAFEPPQSDALVSCAKHGIWLGRFGDPLLGDPEPRHFWDTMRLSAPLEISLEALVSDGRSPIKLACAALPRVSNISTVSNLVGPARMAHGMLIGKLWQLHSYGWDFVQALGDEAPADHRPRATTPGNSRMLGLIVPKLVSQLRHRRRLRNTTELWRVGVRRASRLDALSTSSFDDFRWLQAPAHHYYADPFSISHLGRHFLFVEDFDMAANKGVIVCLPLDRDGTPGRPQTVLERPYHLSYPQVFAHDGEIFMIPETGFNNTVEIYRAVSFPGEWELVRVLFRGPAFDTTVLQEDGRFWFFVTLIDPRNAQRIELLLFHADDLFGDWSMHPASPITRDIRLARCGGAPLMAEGSWIRPAQDGSETYGGALRFQRILRLDPRRYVEEPIGLLKADVIRGASGVHTYNRDEEFEFLDAKSRIMQRSNHS
jgi:hypothetical protein